MMEIYAYMIKIEHASGRVIQSDINLLVTDYIVIIISNLTQGKILLVIIIYISYACNKMVTLWFMTELKEILQMLYGVLKHMEKVQVIFKCKKMET